MELLGCRRQIKELSLSKRKMSMQVQELEGQVRKLANLQDTEEMLRKEEENAALRHAYDDMQAQVRRRGADWNQEPAGQAVPSMNRADTSQGTPEEEFATPVQTGSCCFYYRAYFSQLSFVLLRSTHRWQEHTVCELGADQQASQAGCASDWRSVLFINDTPADAGKLWSMLLRCQSCAYPFSFQKKALSGTTSGTVVPSALTTPLVACQVEGLQMNRFSEVEELVYLRWVNACLRFELRNYKGMSEALTLNASLSPRSQEKAKGLMMEYAYPQRSLTASENGDESEVSVSGSESEPASLDRG
jgi:hypothetical protein